MGLRIVIAACLLAHAAAAQCAAGGKPTGKTCAQAEATHQGCCLGPSELHWCESGYECVKDCGGNPKNSCCAPSLQPGCCDTGIMQLVCSSKPECCTEFWGGGCIAVAMVIYDMQCPQNEATPCSATTYSLCGWDPAKLFYNCAPNTSADPSGVYARDCKACIPSCSGKQCGSDGCGGTCGACGGGAACTDAGLCVSVCQSDCTGKACGPNGCGGSCGVCNAGLNCSAAGQCTAETCAASCFGKSCGSDGCGGSCGACGAGTTCSTSGTCVAVEPGCEPDCAGRDCGDDGCGGTCGACDAWESCSADGDCLPTACTPTCDQRRCGDDGCGGSCGSCDAWETCSPGGECLPSDCAPSCAGKACGPDGCGGSCGVCAADATCSANGVCLPDSRIPIVTCPPGQTPDYDGTCTPIEETGGRGATGCGASRPPTGSGIWLGLAALGLVWLSARRARGGERSRSLADGAQGPRLAPPEAPARPARSRRQIRNTARAPLRAVRASCLGWFQRPWRRA